MAAQQWSGRLHGHSWCDLGDLSYVAARATDNGAMFRVLVNNPFSSAVSAVATVTVTADNVPPTIVRVQTIDSFSTCS
jgi:hypothetical protein